MKLSVAKSGNPRYFTAKLGWKEQFDPKEIELLAAGAVPMLIPPMAVQGKHNNVMEFDVTPYSTLAFYLTCVLSREQFVERFRIQAAPAIQGEKMERAIDAICNIERYDDISPLSALLF